MLMAALNPLSLERQELHLQLDQLVSPRAELPMHMLEPGAWQRASAAAPDLFTNARAGGGGARPRAVAPATNWDAPLANFGSSLDSVASHISSMIGPCAAHQRCPSLRLTMPR